MEVSNIDVAYNYQSKYPLPTRHIPEVSLPFLGDMKFSLQNQDHGRWLLCDGRVFNPALYPDLFALITNSFGGTLANPLLPDMRGRVPGAIGQGIGLTTRTLGTSVGEETHTLTIPEMPAHIHTNSVSFNGLHAHTNSVSFNGTHSHTNSVSANGVHNHTGITSTAGSHTHSSNAVGGQGNLGLCLANGVNTVTDSDSSLGELNVWTTPFALTINADGSHNHTISSDGSHNHTVTIDASGLHNHTVTIDASGLHNHTVTIDSTGGSQPHNNIQPTLFIGNYFIYSIK